MDVGGENLGFPQEPLDGSESCVETTTSENIPGTVFQEGLPWGVPVIRTGQFEAEALLTFRGAHECTEFPRFGWYGDQSLGGFWVPLNGEDGAGGRDGEPREGRGGGVRKCLDQGRVKRHASVLLAMRAGGGGDLSEEGVGTALIPDAETSPQSQIREANRQGVVVPNPANHDIWSLETVNLIPGWPDQVVSG
jgi:hypothetical protein